MFSVVIAAVLRMHVKHRQGDFLFGFAHYYRFNNSQKFLKAYFLFSVSVAVFLSINSSCSSVGGGSSQCSALF